MSVGFSGAEALRSAEAERSAGALAAPDTLPLAAAVASSTGESSNGLIAGGEEEARRRGGEGVTGESESEISSMCAQLSLLACASVSRVGESLLRTT